jgi:hypothetical protein
MKVKLCTFQTPPVDDCPWEPLMSIIIANERELKAEN